MNKNPGKIVRIAGPVVGAVGLENIRLHDMALVGEKKLVGEVIRVFGNQATIQVYEDTSGVRMGEPVYNTGFPLIVELGPGLMGQVYDGLQRPLTLLAEKQGEFLQRGVATDPLLREKLWDFTPCVKTGDLVQPGMMVGTVEETTALQHRILCPPGKSGRVVEVHSGPMNITDTVVQLENQKGAQVNIRMMQRWPVRRPRPIQKRLDPTQPLVTGTRIIDLFFPVAKGGAAVIPGGFGTGKTVTQQSLCSWSDVDVVVYVGCGERGNEMAKVLEDLPALQDPHSGHSLMERTVLIANTSNMPVAAREASIYTGITIAEYYRDMGYDVLMLADSTSRWGEALREISSRLEEIPGEEGYPAYMATRLSEFYERTGRVSCLGSSAGETGGASRSGSITLVGAVSPAGGDFSEPITQSSMRIAGVFWALDYTLSRRRHFPAINWIQSYSLFDFTPWYHDHVAADYPDLVSRALNILRREDELQKIVELVGHDALSETEQETLMIARMIREDLLQQSAMHEIDRYCPMLKSYRMLKILLMFHDLARKALENGNGLSQINNLTVLTEIARMKEIPNEQADTAMDGLSQKIAGEFRLLGVVA